MGKTMSEKILASAAGIAETTAGEILWGHVAKAMMDDILGPRVEIADQMKSIRDEVWDPSKVVVISDHYTPPASVKQAAIVKFTREWARDHGVSNYFESEGPCHQIMVEHGHVLPGQVVLGTDSHTCMGGALGAFATGVGSTEMLGVLLTGKTWLRVPETIQVKWRGKLSDGVMAKDIALKTIGAIGHAGATYKAVEFTGCAIDALSLDQRLAITNMAVEMGAKVGLMSPDTKVVEYLESQNISSGFSLVFSDPDATYCAHYEFRADELVPVVSCPHEVDKVSAVSDVQGVDIDQAYLGSCTGGRYEDLLAAARLLKGRKVAKNVRLLVSPSSRSIWKQANADATGWRQNHRAGVEQNPENSVCIGLFPNGTRTR